MRIKIVKYKFDEKEIPVSYQVNPKTGLFTCDLKFDIQRAIGVDVKENHASLQELEKMVSDGFIKYADSKMTLELLIYVRFGVSGEFLKKPSGEYDSRVCGMREENRFFQMEGFTGRDDRNRISFDYAVLCKCNRNGVDSLYAVEPASNYDEHKKPASYQMKVGEYYTTGVDSRNFNNWKKISYTPQALVACEKTMKIFQSACQFMFDLCTHEDFELLMNSSRALPFLTT